ncbi:Calcium-dependent protein kinase 8 [Cucumispora dikerogammari]|nr:Calcium-dependent protein kinase 8 [Cucumispora dikerogammari]
METQNINKLQTSDKHKSSNNNSTLSINKTDPIKKIDFQVFQLFSHNKLLDTTHLLKYLRLCGHLIDIDSLYQLKLHSNLPINEFITYEEFSLIVKEIKKYAIKEIDIRKSFEYFDEQKTGFIPISVLEKVFLNQVESKDGNLTDLEELIRLLGEDELGRINYERFLRHVYGI